MRERPFAWGSHDCVMGAADAILAMTGEDPAEAWRGTYATRVGAGRVLVEHGGLEQMVSKVLGSPLLGPRLAARGDIVLVDSGEEGPALAVVLGASAVAPAPNGAAFIPMSGWCLGWRV